MDIAGGITGATSRISPGIPSAITPEIRLKIDSADSPDCFPGFHDEFLLGFLKELFMRLFFSENVQS